jgi:predicted dehydrogenase
MVNRTSIKTSSENPLKVVAIGAGYFSQFHYEAWQRVTGATVVGNCNRTLAGAVEIGNKFGIPEQSDDLEKLIETCQPDLIDIITPPHTHVRNVEIAAKAGVDCIIQKPFGESIEQARTMVKLAQKAGIKLIVHENFRFMPWYRKIKTVLDSGRLGDVLNVQFNLRPGDGQGAEAYLDRQPYFQSMDKLLIHETGVHLVDTFRYLFGDVQSVYADLRQCNPVIKGEDAGIVIFQMADTLRAVFDGNRLLDHNAPNKRVTMGEMLIEGTQGSLRLDGNAQLWQRAFNSTEEIELNYQWNNANFGGDCVYNLIEHVVEHFNNDAPLENQGFEYLDNIAIEEAIYASHAQSKRIDL